MWRFPPQTTPFCQAKILDWFHHLDHNHDGTLERGDLDAIAESVIAKGAWKADTPQAAHLRETHHELWAEMWSHMDEDCDGTVSRDEFVGFWKGLGQDVKRRGLPPWAWRLVRSTFAAYDHDGDGRITGEEYALYLQAIGSDADAAAAFAQLDLDGNGHLDLDELKLLFGEWLTAEEVASPGNVLMTGRVPPGPQPRP